MENRGIENMRYWVEPAHPMVVKLYDDLVAIYRFVKDKFQNEIDAAFDRASQQIGFVVTTTVPVMLEVGEGGALKSLSMGSECLKGTALEKELLIVFDLMRRDSKINVSAGAYNMALFWYDAVKLRLRTDWMEPAHPVFQLQSELMGLQRSPQSAAAMNVIAQPQPWLEPAHHPGLSPWLIPVPHRPWCEPAHTPWLEPAHHGPWGHPWMEPAHHGPWCRPWMEPAHPVFEKASVPQKGRETRMFEHQEPAHHLDRRNQIILEKSVLVSAIDEVYPELKLGERLNQAQYAMSPTLPLPPPRAVWPGVREPAHLMAAAQWAGRPSPDPWRQIMADIAQVLERYGPHPEPWKDQLLSEIASVMGKYIYAMLNPQPLPPRMAAWPGVREPAHMMAPQWASGPTPYPWGQMNFPGVREPAHPMAGMQPEMPPELSPQMLSEMAAVMRRYGFQI